MSKRKQTQCILLILSLVFSSAIFAQSGREYRRSAVHNANLVRTVFGNWGVIGQPAQDGPRGAWIYDTNGYIGDVSPLIGAEVEYDYFDSTAMEWTTKKFHSVVVSPASRPSTGAEMSPTGKQWTFEPVAGYFNENQEKVAMSTDPNSWPDSWPDKSSEWNGSWNGFFGLGVTNADQESYFVMDDNNDEEFNFSQNNNLLEPNQPNGRGIAFKPDSTDPTLNGLGLEVKVRGLQWQQFLAADVIFWLYEVTNKSTTDYNKVAFGMLAGTYVGVTGTDDNPQEYDDDYSFFDVQRDLTYTGDYPNNNNRNPKWQGNVGMVGYAFLESPGNPYDGIDNDADNRPDAHPPGTDLMFTAPLFTESSFNEVVYNRGDQIVLIDADFNRQVVTVDQDTFEFSTRGWPDTVLIAGVSQFQEGNVWPGSGNINENVYDGIDNDLDGLIDENYLLHYRQLRRDAQGNTLIDTLNPVSYIDYFTGQGMDDPLIDERRDDGIDNDGDWNAEFDDVGLDGKAGTGDFGELDGQPTSGAGTNFPGEPNIDKTDVDESDQIGLTSFNYFTPANEFPMAEDEKLWDWLAPGFFEVPSSIQNNEPIEGEDGDFIYGSGYFPLRAGQTERFSLALVYGHDKSDLLKNRTTVQDIYDSDYRFPQPPDKPNLTVVPDDGQVTLYWDRIAEQSIDPVTKERDFEGYKIYKATDPDFNDVRSITNANGVVTGYKPLAQFDKDNDIHGLFEASSDLFQEAEGYTINLGSNTGLRHSYIDTDVENGRRYFYAVVAYDRGDSEKDIFPSENTKFISVQPDGGIITDQNTAMVRPEPKVAGYHSRNSDRMLDQVAGLATGYIDYEILDETKLSGDAYRVTFQDTRTDGIDNDGDWNELTDDVGSDGDPNTIDADSTQNNGEPDVGEPNFEWRDPQEFAPVTSRYSVLNVSGYTETLMIDTSFVFLENRHLKVSSILISPADNPGNYLDTMHFEIDSLRGKIRIKPSSALSPGSYTLNYEYFPVYNSPNIQGNPHADETKDSDIFDGIQLLFKNNWAIFKIDSLSYWENPEHSLNYSFRTDKVSLPNGTILTGVAYPSKFELQFGDTSEVLYETPRSLIEFTNQGLSEVLWPPPRKTNFKLYDTINNTTIPFMYSGGYMNADSVWELTPNGLIETYIRKPDSTYQYSWVMQFTSTDQDTPRFSGDDKLYVETTRPFRSSDVFAFATQVPEAADSTAKHTLDEIQVVPNPYVVANTMEAPLPPNITSGRGERRIEFRKIPKDAKVHIFTASGAHVITLNQSGNIHSGSLAWNLKSKENLDVAYGVYFYIVESDVGKKSGKLAVIK